MGQTAARRWAAEREAKRMSFYSFGSGEEAVVAAIASLMSIPSSLIQIAVYVFSSLALYTIAKRRGLTNPWLSWIPVANVWILGSIADQYRYVARGEIRSKRKVLLTLQIISAVLVFLMVVFAISMVVGAITGAVAGRPENAIMQHVVVSASGLLVLIVPLLGVSVATAIIRYMALYDLYSSCDPENKVIYLVIGILIGITEPIFLFLCRNKDLGMPPRRDDAL